MAALGYHDTPAESKLIHGICPYQRLESLPVFAVVAVLQPDFADDRFAAPPVAGAGANQAGRSHPAGWRGDGAGSGLSAARRERGRDRSDAGDARASAAAGDPSEDAARPADRAGWAEPGVR